MTEEAVTEAPPPFALERVVFFTDAVFAIAITLLVIELRLPETAADLSGAALDEALVDVLPKVFSYVLSFVVIGLYWLAHWRRFGVVNNVDETLARLNLLLLGIVAFIPFPTGLMGEHGDEPTVVVIYAVVMAAAGLVGALSWVYAQRHGLVSRRHSRRWMSLSTARAMSVPIMFVASLPLVLVHPYVAEASWALILPVQWYIVRQLRREEA